MQQTLHKKLPKHSSTVIFWKLTKKFVKSSFNIDEKKNYKLLKIALIKIFKLNSSKFITKFIDSN